MAFPPLMRLWAFLFVVLITRHVGANDVYPTTKDDRQFLAQVVKAIDKKDTGWIADHMLYPLSITESNRTQIVKTKAEFIPILKRDLSKSVSAKIKKDSKEPLLKNWGGVMVGDGIIWFGQFQLKGQTSWFYQILAIGNFAYQSDWSISDH
jgi:hypothetical protein